MSDSQPFATFLSELAAAANQVANTQQASSTQSESAPQQTTDTLSQQQVALQQPESTVSQPNPPVGEFAASGGDTTSAETTDDVDATANLPASPQQLIAKYGATTGSLLARLRNSRIANVSSTNGSASDATANAAASVTSATTTNSQASATAQTTAADENDTDTDGAALPAAIFFLAAEAASAGADDQKSAPAVNFARGLPDKRSADADSTDSTQTDAAADGNTANSAAATQTAAATQPVAAAFVLNAQTTSAPPLLAAGAVIGAESYARFKAGTGQANGRDAAVSQSANEEAAAGNAPTGGAASATSPTADSNAGTKGAQASSGAPAQSAAQGADALVSSPQTDSGTPPADAAATSRTIAALFAAAESGDGARASNQQSPTNTTSTTLPSFGLLESSLPAAQTAAAGTSGVSEASASVPIAGLPVVIAARAQSGSNQFDIRLDPPELGRIDVRLDVDSNGQVTSHITADRQETLNLLQSQQPQLQHALEQAGLKTTDNGLQFSLRDQSFGGQNGGNNNAPQSAASQLTIPDSDLLPVETTQVYSRYSLGGGLDIRV